jgi:hypothetical protein
VLPEQLGVVPGGAIQSVAETEKRLESRLLKVPDTVEDVTVNCPFEVLKLVSKL